jgi:hypothetical protein
LGILKNRVLGRIFGTEDEVSGGWRELNIELYNLHSSQNIIRMRLVGHVAYMGT